MKAHVQVQQQELLGNVHRDRWQKEELERCSAAQELEYVPNIVTHMDPQEVNNELGIGDSQHNEWQVQAQVAE